MLTNHVSLIGRLTKDAKITKSEKKNKDSWKLARFTLACDDGIDQNGDKVAQFISCKAWNTLANTIENYTAKGQLIAVEGKIVANNYEKDGEMIYSYEVLVTGLQLLGKQNAPADEDESKDDEDEEDEKPVNNKKYNRKGKK